MPKDGNSSKKNMLKQNLRKALTSIVLFVFAIVAAGYLFGDEMSVATNWVVDHIGFVGLCLIAFVADTLVTPLSPDILLVVLANSHLAENGFIYALILGSLSVVAGMLGWSIGRWLGHFTFVRRLFGRINDEQRDFIEKYGFWAIVVGAITPLPYSFTCWTAGVLELRWTKVLAASVLTRLPRVVASYWLITVAGQLFG